MSTSTRHRWGDRVECGPHKSERQCLRCDMVRASMHDEDERGRGVHWKEFWRDQELVLRGGATPPCDARLERETAALEAAA